MPTDSRPDRRVGLVAVVACGLAFLAPARAQTSAQPGPLLTVDASVARHPISPDIYGINEYGEWFGTGTDSSFIGKYPFTSRRWGGDNSVSYNWKLDSNNTAANWYFETFPMGPADVSKLPDGSSFDRWVERSQRNGKRTVATVPIIGWTTSTRTEKQCSYSVRKYGAQKDTDQWAPDCGKGVLLDGRPILNDPRDVYVEVGPDFAQQWVNHVVERYGTARQGGVWLWELDNEPTWWHAVHKDIHPTPATFDEMLDRGIRWAAAIKAADPTAKVGGPTAPGWESYFYSANDLVNGWNTGPDWKYWNNPVDCIAHSAGGVCAGFIPWYLDRMREQEKSGVRLLDYLDVHGYLGPDGLPSKHDPARPDYDRLRLTSTRLFWDPAYMPQREDMIAMDRKYGTGTPQIIPRFRKWVDEHYPGTRIAITEYDWGAREHITGALAQADLFGIFGREQLDLATSWGSPSPDQPGSFAWRVFLDYDGRGNGFGETSVSAESADPDALSIFGAERSDGALTVLVINKTTGDLRASIGLRGFEPQGTAQSWQYSQADLSRIVRLEDIPVGGGSVAATFPAYSMALFVIPKARSADSVPKPVVQAVVNAASYGAAIAPGQMVAIFGTDLGPAIANTQPELANPDVLTTALSGVRVLFDGIPAPMLAATKLQVNAVVPYAVASRRTVNVQVENQGNRSEPLPVTMSPAGPGVFTVDASGKGQGAILNYIGDGRYEQNSSSKPAAKGSIISVFMTGEGVTNPPGIDGRIATNIFPRPLGEVTATIGGRSAKVLYAGGAWGNTAGFMQVNLEVPLDAPEGAQPVQVTVAGQSSRADVTVAIR